MERVTFHRPDVKALLSTMACMKIDAGGDTAPELARKFGVSGFPTLERLCLAPYYEDLFVTPDRRGHGVARQLIEAATDHARRAGCRSLLAGCSPRDVPMWEHLGFRRIGTLVSRDL